MFTSHSEPRWEICFPQCQRHYICTEKCFSTTRSECIGIQTGFLFLFFLQKTLVVSWKNVSYFQQQLLSSMKISSGICNNWPIMQRARASQEAVLLTPPDTAPGSLSGTPNAIALGRQSWAHRLPCNHTTQPCLFLWTSPFCPKNRPRINHPNFPARQKYLFLLHQLLWYYLQVKLEEGYWAWIHGWLSPCPDPSKVRYCIVSASNVIALVKEDSSDPRLKQMHGQKPSGQ